MYFQLSKTSVIKMCFFHKYGETLLKEFVTDVRKIEVIEIFLFCNVVFRWISSLQYHLAPRMSPFKSGFKLNCWIFQDFLGCQDLDELRRDLRRAARRKKDLKPAGQWVSQWVSDSRLTGRKSAINLFQKIRNGNLTYTIIDRSISSILIWITCNHTSS